MLSEKQLILIERLLAGEELVKDILKDLEIPKSTFYDWKKKNKAFQDAYDEAIEEKVAEARKNIRANINDYIKELAKLTKNGKNEMAKINAIKTLFNLAGLEDNSQELVIKQDESDSKNYLLDLMNKENEKVNEDNSDNIEH